MIRFSPYLLAVLGVTALMILAAFGKVWINKPDNGSLYAGRALQTGKLQGADRASIAASFSEVLVKVSGDPEVVRDSRFSAVAVNLEQMVTGIDYRDRMAGIPIGDEQGTRERPYELTVHFDPAKTDNVLAALDKKPFTGPRPRLLVLISIKNSARTYLLETDSEFGVDQRDALFESAFQAGLPVQLPEKKLLQESSVRIEQLGQLSQADIRKLTLAAGAEAGLIGTLIWNDGARGWLINWHFADPTHDERWSLADVTFDRAFQNAMFGTLSILAGKGTPKSQ